MLQSHDPFGLWPRQMYPNSCEMAHDEPWPTTNVLWLRIRVVDLVQF